MSARPKRIHRRRSSNVLPVILSLIVIGLLAAALAWVWQGLSMIRQEPEPFYPSWEEAAPSGEEPQTEQETVEEQPDDSVPEADPEKTASEENPEEPETETDGAKEQPDPAEETKEPSEEGEETEDDYDPLVPASTRVNSSYFDDAMFVGDSVTEGVEAYDVMPNATVIAYTGLHLTNVMTRKVIPGANGDLTILEAMRQYTPKKIYLMIGSNTLAYVDVDDTAAYYETFLDAIIEQHPGAIIYVESLPPIHESIMALNYPKAEMTNQKIDRFNAKLFALATKKHLHYVNVAEVLKDDTGGLSEEATTDGLHFKSDYYIKWMDYLKTHTVTEE